MHEKLQIMPSKARLKKFEIYKKAIVLVLIITVQIFSLCLKHFPYATAKFPVFCLSGKSKNQIPCYISSIRPFSQISRFEAAARSIPDWGPTNACT